MLNSEQIFISNNRIIEEDRRFRQQRSLEEERLSRIKTKEEILHETERLLKELDNLEKKKKQDGCDVSESYNFLKRQFEILDVTKGKLIKYEKASKEKPQSEKKNEKENENENKKDKDVQNLDTKFPVQAVPKQKKAEDLFSYFVESMNKKVNVYIIFHCCVLQTTKDFEDLKLKVASALENFPGIKMAYKIICSSFTEKTPDKIFYDFKNFSKMTSLKCYKIEKLENIRHELVDLSMDNKSLLIVCNIAKLSCIHRKNEIELFINGTKDSTQALLDYNQVKSFNFIVDEKEKKNKTAIKVIKNFENFFEESNIKTILDTRKNSLLAETLFKLKRTTTRIKTIDELKEIVIQQGVNKSKKVKAYDQHVSIEKNVKKVELNNIFETNLCELKKKKDLSIMHFKRKIPISNYDDANICCVHKNRIIYECQIHLLVHFDYSKCCQFLEIHETAKFFVTEFNKQIGENLILIPEARILHLYEDRCYMFGMKSYIKRAFENKEDGKVMFKLRDPIMQAFFHFCQIYSKETTSIIDLRTIVINDKQLLLTDPIIFSSFDKYSNSSNLGLEAINYLMSEHNCNNYCKKFKQSLK